MQGRGKINYKVDHQEVYKSDRVILGGKIQRALNVITNPAYREQITAGLNVRTFSEMFLVKLERGDLVRNLVR